MTWAAETSRSSERALLLVLERGREGWSLLDARTAPVEAKVRRSGGPETGPVFALFDGEGHPLVAGRLRVPDRLHGPVIDEEGLVRCVSVPLESPTIAVRLPMPAGAARLTIFEPTDFAPTSGAELAAALGARADDAGLRRLASFDLSDLDGEAG